jgi:uncharacterized protein (TIGR00106 family)
MPPAGLNRTAHMRYSRATNLPLETVAMKVMIDLCVVPLGVGVSVSNYVAACERVIREAGLKARLHAYGTNIEGEWDAVMAAVKRCHETVHAMGAPRITTTIKLGTRTDRDQTMEDKVRSVEEKMAG